MKKEIKFSKISAAGNDFVLIDNRGGVLKNDLRKFSRKICARKTGVGVDGLIIVEKSRKADFRMRIFNLDGSEAEMCGNGARACALFAFDSGIAGGRMSFETLAGIVDARVLKDGVSIKMVVNPSDFRKGVKIKFGAKTYDFGYADTGVPHAVVFLNRIDNVDVEGFGRFIRNHREFEPRGTNVDFVKVIDRHNIEVRTYERGVEGETLACGTGAAASVIMSAEIKGTVSPVNARVKSGDILTVSFRKLKDETYEDVSLKGPAVEIFKGTLAKK